MLTTFQLNGKSWSIYQKQFTAAAAILLQKIVTAIVLALRGEASEILHALSYENNSRMRSY